MTAAPIRYNNPGAQWPGESARKFGGTSSVTLNDGQGNKIAVFPDSVHGAAAQFDLLNSKYTGMPLAQAVSRWSGGNSVDSYLAGITKATGLTPDSVLTPDLMRNPAVAVPLARAMAQHESGQPYPMTDDQWDQAFRMANGGAQPTPAPAAAPAGPSNVAVNGAINSVNPATAPENSSITPAPMVASAAPQAAPAADQGNPVLAMLGKLGTDDNGNSTAPQIDLSTPAPLQLRAPNNQAALLQALAARLGNRGLA